jgi:hypothetical protein
MPKIEPSNPISMFNLKDEKEFMRQIDLLYERLANAINTKTDTVYTDTAPATTDNDFELGASWIDTSADKVYVLTNLTMVASVLTATWIETS